MSAWAKPGVKCVCVDDDAGRFKSAPFIWAGDRFEVVKDRVYTIRDVQFIGGFGELCVKFAELADRGPFDKGYCLSRFRPLVTKTQEQDVALFRHILDGLPVGQDA